jgi:hypothetical protein
MMAIIGVALLLHESVYLSSRGLGHFLDDFGPALGFHLAQKWRVLLHVALSTCSSLLILCPENSVNISVCGLLLLVLIATFPRRIPNHLPLALFMLLAAIVEQLASPRSPTSFLARGTIELFVAGTFFFAGFHKLNASYLRKATSCGFALIIHYLLQRGVRLNRVPPFLPVLAIYLVLALELSLPAFLLFRPTERSAALVGIVLVTSFGFLGHVHFAVLMLAGLAASVQPQIQVLDPAILLTTAPAAFVLALTFGNRYAYRYSWLALANYFVLALVAIRVTQCTLGTPMMSYVGVALHKHPGLTFALSLLFVLNAIAPYLGLKWDGSFAMFSNLRPDVWDHLIIRRPLRLAIPRYLTDISLVISIQQTGCAAVFESVFPRPSIERYTIGYVAEAALYLRRVVNPPTEILLIGRDIKTNAVVAVGEHARTSLRLFERLSVFPYSLPDPAEPLCA